jgi:hypothetical protein
MARIISVIYKPHLATYKAYENTEYRCTIVCEYKVIIETDDKEIFVASILDDSELQDIELDKLIEHLKKDGGLEDEWVPTNRCVGVDDINCFINGHIEVGDTPLDALFGTLSNIRESGALCTDEVKELLNEIQL